MPSLDTTIEFGLCCNKHTHIKLDCDVKIIRGFDTIFVEPCDECLHEQYNKGMDDGTSH